MECYEKAGARNDDWWLFERSALSVRLIRLALCTTLLCYLLHTIAPAVNLLERTGLFDAALTPWASIEGGQPLLGRGLPSLVIASAIVVGIACTTIATNTRYALPAALALCLLVTSLYSALLPVATSEDLAACWCSFWLVVLPTARQSNRIPAMTVNLMLANTLALHLAVNWGRLAAPMIVEGRSMACASIVGTGAILLPQTGLRRAAVLLVALCDVHAMQQSNQLVIYGSLMAALLGFWGESEQTLGERSPVPISAGAAVAGSYLVVLLLFAGARLAGTASISTTTERVLRTFGLLPVSVEKPRRIDGDLFMRPSDVVTFRTPLFANGLLGDSRRQALLSYFAADVPSELHPLRRSILTKAVKRACGANTRMATAFIIEYGLNGEFTSIAHGECVEPDRDPVVLWD